MGNSTPDACYELRRHEVRQMTNNMLWGSGMMDEDEILGVYNISDLFLIVAWLDIQGVVRRMKRLSKWWDWLYDSIIDRRNMRMRLDGAVGEKVKSKNFFCRLRMKKTLEGQ
ncbi:hypothetical protein ACLOJK_005414 [Asimina triloba]